MTTQADEKAFGDCLDFIIQSFVVGRPLQNRLNDLRFLLGNHDLLRNLTYDISTSDKFKPFLKMLADRNLPLAPVGSPIIVTKRIKRQAQLDLIFVNSCIGCGEKKHLPQPLRDGVSDAAKHHFEQVRSNLDPTASSIAGDAVAQKIESQMRDYLFTSMQSIDTPLIDEIAVEMVCAHISKMPPTAVPIVAAHHNILPQSRPRIDIYTEMINAGYIRQALLNLGRPVLFLHGHIHDHPLDVLTDPRRPNSMLINISAPLLVNGFIVIEFCFNSRSLPLGIRVQHYRSGQAGMQIPEIVEIPFWNGATASHLVSQLALLVLRFLKPRDVYEMPLIFDELRHELDGPKRIEQLQDAIVELEWLGLINVQALDRRSKLWRITKNS